MHRAGYLLFAILAGCSGAALNPAGGGGTGGGGMGGNAVGGAGGGTDPCAGLACLQHVNDLMVQCTAGGSSVCQQAPTSNARCYDNGVRVMQTEVNHLMIMDVTNGSSTTGQVTDTYEVKLGSTLCYTRTFVSTAALNGSTSSLVMTDAAGTTLVTANKDINNVYTVTCPGSPPTVFTTSCGVPETVLTDSYLLPANSPYCAAGTCTF